MNEIMFANVRGNAIQEFGEGADEQFQINKRGDLQVAQALPERTDIVRLGNSWGVQIKEGNAFTLLITVPTTRAELSLQNGEVGGGKSYVIDRVFVKAVTSLGAANYLTILAQLVAPGTALVADSANKTLNSLSGKPNYGGKAQIAVGSTATGCVGDKWTILGGLSLPAATTIAAAYDVPVYGRYVVPPQGSFNLNAQEAVSGGTAILGLEYHEIQLALA